MNTIFWYCVIKCVDICNNWKCSPFPSFMLTELPQTKMLPLVFLQSINNMSSLLFRGYSIISVSINSETNLTIQDRQKEGEGGREGGRKTKREGGREQTNSAYHHQLTATPKAYGGINKSWKVMTQQYIVITYGIF